MKCSKMTHRTMHIKKGLDRLLGELKEFENTRVNDWNLRHMLKWFEKGHSTTKEFFDVVKKWRSQVLIT